MSTTELHLHHDLPKLRIPNLKMEKEKDKETPKSKSVNEEEEQVMKRARAGVGVEEEEEIYRTPTSKESRIPEMVTCPPAPKKAKTTGSCKRKLIDEFQTFFEVPSNEDMDDFFRSTFPKRTCPCPCT